MIGGRSGIVDAAVDDALDRMVAEARTACDAVATARGQGGERPPEASGILDVAAVLIAASVPTLTAGDRATIRADLLARASGLPIRSSDPRGNLARRFGANLAGIMLVAGLAWLGHAITTADVMPQARGPAGDGAIGTGVVARPPAAEVARLRPTGGDGARTAMAVPRHGAPPSLRTPAAAPAPADRRAAAGSVVVVAMAPWTSTPAPAAVSPPARSPAIRTSPASVTWPASATPGAAIAPALPAPELTPEPASPTFTPHPTAGPATSTPAAATGIAGRVTDPDGRAIAGAVVIAEPYDSAGWFVVARAADDGEYKLDVAPGRFRVWAESPGHATQWWEGRSDAAAANPVVVGPAVAMGIDFTLPSSAAPATPAIAQEVKE